MSPRVEFTRAASGGYTSVHVDDVEVGLIGRGPVLTVVGPEEACGPIRKLDGVKFRTLADAQRQILEAFGLRETSTHRFSPCEAVFGDDGQIGRHVSRCSRCQALIEAANDRDADVTS